MCRVVLSVPIVLEKKKNLRWCDPSVVVVVPPLDNHSFRNAAINRSRICNTVDDNNYSRYTGVRVTRNIELVCR